MATPAEVRREIKRRGLPYDVYKTKHCWYVVDGDASGWYESSLHTNTFANRPASYWVDAIQFMRDQYSA